MTCKMNVTQELSEAGNVFMRKILGDSNFERLLSMKAKYEFQSIPHCIEWLLESQSMQSAAEPKQSHFQYSNYYPNDVVEIDDAPKTCQQTDEERSEKSNRRIQKKRAADVGTIHENVTPESAADHSVHPPTAEPLHEKFAATDFANNASTLNDHDDPAVASMSKPPGAQAFPVKTECDYDEFIGGSLDEADCSSPVEIIPQQDFGGMDNVRPQKRAKFRPNDATAHSSTFLPNPNLYEKVDRFFVCPFCHTYKTQFKGNMTQHYRIHTDERPYACEFCHMRFRRKHHVHSHKLHVHKHLLTATVSALTANNVPNLTLNS